jgi:chromosome segregation ATPase
MKKIEFMNEELNLLDNVERKKQRAESLRAMRDNKELELDAEKSRELAQLDRAIEEADAEADLLAAGVDDKKASIAKKITAVEAALAKVEEISKTQSQS